MSKMIIDVSSYNGAVDWTLCKKNGVDGAIIKIIRKDLSKDNQFENNYKGCHGNKMPWGVYNYSYATTVDKAKSDMKLVCDILDGLDRTYFKYGIWFDIEDKVQAALSKSQIADIINAAQKVVESRGYKFGVYTGMAYYKEHIDASKVNCNNWWIARYYKGYDEMVASDTPNEKYKPDVVSNLMAWQYTSSGVIGIGASTGNGGHFDFNILYREYEETKTEVAVKVPTYSVGKKYTLQVELKVRKGAGTNYAAKKYSQLTVDGRKHDKDGDGALDKGTVVTCKQVKKVGNDIWIRCPSGWLAAYYKGKIYVK